MKQEEIKAFLRWAGSKKQILPRLENFWNDSFGRYIEPFAGSAALFFRIKPKRALLGDINKELIDTFIEVKYRPEKVSEYLNRYSRDSECYYRVRSIKISEIEKSERAARFIYLNRLCFNGLYRTNKKGEFNVPYGGDRSGDLPKLQSLTECSKALKGARLLALDFDQMLKRIQDNDFVYMDPPYAVEGKRVFVEYGPKTFDKTDLDRLSSRLKAIDRKGAGFVLSYTDSSEARALAKDWNSRRLQVKRNIAGFAGARKKTYELVITNFTESMLNSSLYGQPK